MRLWLDCDPGVDDTLTLLALSKSPLRKDLLGVSVVAGNQKLSVVTKNAEKALSYFKETIPLYQKQVPAYLAKTLEETLAKVTILATGPLTNIAEFLTTYPQLKPKIEKIILMGGSLSGGNITPYSEFNFYCDANSAKVVLEGDIPIVMAGLDVTKQALIYEAEYQLLKGKNPTSDYAFQLLENHPMLPKQMKKAIPLHDLCTLGYLCHPEFFKGEDYNLTVATKKENQGEVLLSKESPMSLKNTFVLKEINRPTFIEWFLKILQK